MPNTSPVLNQRRAGMLLHITSLPSTLGLGSLGRHAYRFVDFLKECNLSVWQMLPIHPLHRVPKNTPHRDFLSPYQPMSVHAGNPMLINLQKLIDRGWLPRMSLPTYSVDQIEKAFECRCKCLKDAYFHFSRHASSKDKQDFQDFVEQHRDWLEDYALFCALKDFYGGGCWWHWNENHRNHDPDALIQFRQRSNKKYYPDQEQYYFEQFAFFTQWQELKEYANENGVYLFGDMPFFVARDSVEMWAHREYFLTDKWHNPKFFSGVSPKDDRFSPGEGQCWGHPLYEWKKLEEDNFQWWMKRFHVINCLFDIVCLSYFREFHRCWAINNPIDDGLPNPKKGEWCQVPGKELFAKLQEENLLLNVVVKDIEVSSQLIELRDEFKFHGVKLLQIAFNSKSKVPLRNEHLPHHQTPTNVVYTGTHDNDTIMGWFERLRKDKNRQKFVCDYLNAKSEEMPWPMIKSAFQSVAKLSMVPMQDILSLGTKYRMNTPGISKYNNNWRWQFDWFQVTPEIEQKLRELVDMYERK